MESRRSKKLTSDAAASEAIVQRQRKLHADGAGAPRPALDAYAAISAELRDKRAAVFLDYDGTLTGIAARPELAVLSEETRAVIRRLAAAAPVAIISGRDRADVEKLVALPKLIYAGSHGFDIAGPGNLEIRHPEGSLYAAAVGRAGERLRAAVAPIAGALVEPKKFAVAVHFRQVAKDRVGAVEAAVDGVLAEIPELRKTTGKKVLELRPRLDWDKGKAVLWLLQALGLDRADVLPFFLGDDTTDEDAFAALAGRGVGIFVGHPGHPTAARYVLESPAEASRFLGLLAQTLEKKREA